jgi:hypothetical protein
MKRKSVDSTSLTATKIHIDKGGYDSRGRYWGIGAPLYLVVMKNFEGKWLYSAEFRAKSAAEAKKLAKTEIATYIRRGGTMGEFLSQYRINPRTHFPKTKRGRPKEMKKWHILRSGKPPIRFNATKKDAHHRAQIYALRHGHIVLDGPK